MRWPWSRSQSRSGGFEAALVADAVAQATGVAVSAGITGGLQTAAGLVSRSLSAAAVDGDMGLLTPHVLASFGYDLVRHGQSLWRFDVGEDGRPRLTRAYASSDPVVAGGPEPESRVYALTVPGPTATRTEWVSAAEVLHVRINESSYLPWRGQAPLAVAALTRAAGGRAGVGAWPGESHPVRRRRGPVRHPARDVAASAADPRGEGA